MNHADTHPRRCPICGGAFRRQPLFESYFAPRTDYRRFRETHSRLWLCPSCGTISRDARFEGEEVAEFFGQTGFTDFRREQDHLAAKGGLFRHLLSHVQGRFGTAREGSWFVDFGCSYGHLGKIFQEAGWRVAGVDVAPNILEHHRLHGTFPVYPSLDVPEIPDGQVTAIAMIDALDYTEDPEAVLRTAWRKLRPGGLVFVRLRNVNPHLRLAVRLIPFLGPYWVRRIEGSYKFYFTPRGFRRFARKAGFSGVRLIYRFGGYRYSPAMQAVHFVAQKVAEGTRGVLNAETAFYAEITKGEAQ